ncbi:SGNH/GDSL hydrolase family protein [Streptomyces sp. WAC01280]|uniref:SGNH/GDSL hydrolase family protein n=1 Tax=Streptomyces sp. WAC01280 TaxID=2487424 RepID=UPI000F7A214A|nr:SGNH/GDSL hydrolase family protein [Streptomyces sp. WAC01280]RSS53874.1 SGNH/GDSL hydrolase family protein [Streptomyces sp. WAC01280]
MSEDRTGNMLEKLVRFQQPEKTLRYLGELPEARLADLFGLDTDAYRALLRDFDDQARATAAELLKDSDFADLADRLPFRPGQRIVALGESTTADRLSWFSILRHLLPDSVVLVNLAVSGLTTTQALAQLPQLSFLRPDWVLCMLGANDTQRLGRGAGAPGTRLVSEAETARNLLALRELGGTDDLGDRWIWLTPSSVDQERADAYPHFRRAGIGWTREDIDGVADFLLGLPDLTVDTRQATAGLHLDDGIHLTLDGQRAVAVALVEALAKAADAAPGTETGAGTGTNTGTGTETS